MEGFAMLRGGAYRTVNAAVFLKCTGRLNGCLSVLLVCFFIDVNIAVECILGYPKVF